jgi:hypothetical protein
MKITLHKILILLLLGLFLQSCGKNEELLVINVAKEFEIQLLEKLSPENNEFELIITTLNSQSCINAEIAYSDNQTADKVGIRIDGVSNPVDCIPGVGPVSEYVSLLLDNGSIAIDISLKNEVVNSGTLNLFSDRYSINLETHHGIEYSSKEIKRIPEELIWGYIASEDQATQNNITEILSSFNSTSGFSNIELSKGDYGHFSIDNDSKISGQSIAEHIQDADEFIFYSTKSISDIQQLVDSIKSEYPLLEIFMVTTNGDIIS